MLETIHRSEGLNTKPKPLWRPFPTCKGLLSVAADLAVNGRIGITATLVIFYRATLVYNPHKAPRCHSLGSRPHSLEQMCQLVVNYDYGTMVGLPP